MPYKSTNRTVLRQREDGRWVNHKRQPTPGVARAQAEASNIMERVKRQDEQKKKQ